MAVLIESHFGVKVDITLDIEIDDDWYHCPNQNKQQSEVNYGMATDVAVVFKWRYPLCLSSADCRTSHC